MPLSTTSYHMKYLVHMEQIGGPKDGQGMSCCPAERPAGMKQANGQGVLHGPWVVAVTLQVLAGLRVCLGPSNSPMRARHGSKSTKHYHQGARNCPERQPFIVPRAPDTISKAPGIVPRVPDIVPRVPETVPRAPDTVPGVSITKPPGTYIG